MSGADGAAGLFAPLPRGRGARPIFGRRKPKRQRRLFLMLLVLLFVTVVQAAVQAARAQQVPQAQQVTEPKAPPVGSLAAPGPRPPAPQTRPAPASKQAEPKAVARPAAAGKDAASAAKEEARPPRRAARNRSAPQVATGPAPQTAGPQAASPAAALSPAPAPAAPSAPTITSTFGRQALGLAITEAPLATFRVTTLRPVKLAVYAGRGGLWIASDQSDVQPGPKLVGGNRASEAGAIRPIIAPAGSAWFIPIPETWVARAKLNGLTWNVELFEGAAAPDLGVPAVGFEPDPARRRADAALNTAGLPVRVIDPLSGDNLIFVPVYGENANAGRAQSLLQAESLAAAVGMAVRVLDDRVRLSIEPNRVVLSELSLTAPPPAQVKVRATVGMRDDPLKVEPYVGLSATQRLGQRWHLQHLAAVSNPADQVGPYIELTRLYLARSEANEAWATLILAIRADPAIEALPEVGALKLVAAALRGDRKTAEAAAQVTAGILPERLWLAVAAFRTRDFDDAASGFLPLPDLPEVAPELAGTVLRMAVESALMQNNPQLVAALLARDPDRLLLPKVVHAWGEGMIQLAEDKAADAVATLETAIRSPDMRIAVPARLVQIDAEYKAKLKPAKMVAEQAIGLAMAWRGDDTEARALRLAATAYRDGGDAKAFFEALGKAERVARSIGLQEEVKRERIAAARAYFIKGEADKLPPLDALALFQANSGLLPPGREAELATRRMADRLIELELLDRAARIVLAQAERARGAERLTLGARAAAIRILNSEYDAALTALERTDDPGLPPQTLLALERRLLKARALHGIGRAEDALHLIAGDPGKDADRLRADLARRAGRYDIAIAALSRLLPAPPAHGQASDEEATVILHRAFALSLAGDGPGLAGFVAAYGPSVAGKPEETALRMLAGEAGSPEDVVRTRSKLGETDLFGAFLQRYRQPGATITPDISVSQAAPGAPSSASPASPVPTAG